MCEKCQKEKDREELQKHHIIPKAILDGMKYKIKHRISNKMLVCEKCYQEIHRRFHPEKYYWKKLCDKTLKMKDSEKFDNLILEVKEFQLR